jgi:erythronate-4-phosphate dehydrogenase
VKRLVADKNILFVDEYFSNFAEIIRLDNSDINNDSIKNADILLIRSKTKVTKDLLINSKVNLIGSCVTGDDHLDKTYLETSNINSYVAKGCNANAVANYVEIVTRSLQKDKRLALSGFKVAVIGVGRIGSLVSNFMKSLNAEVILCDPLRAKNEDDFPHTALNEIKGVDMICLHTPITYGKHSTYHMINKDFLEKQKPGSILLNAGRGEAINSNDLKQYGQHMLWCLDVFESEPKIDLDIVKSSYFVSPHIAGHSIEAKQRGTEMVFQSAAKIFDWKIEKSTQIKLQNEFNIEELINKHKHLSEDMKKAKNMIEFFTNSRKNYMVRNEW